MNIITPTIGRRVWYWPSDFDRGTSLQSRIQQGDGSQACDAGIAYVHSDRMVNLSVADHNGTMHARCSVRLLQGDDVAAPGEAHATWMPYQKGQAATTAAVETKTYPDGTVATGVAPLPEKSPTERQGELLTEDPDHAIAD